MLVSIRWFAVLHYRIYALRIASLANSHSDDGIALQSGCKVITKKEIPPSPELLIPDEERPRSASFFPEFVFPLKISSRVVRDGSNAPPKITSVMFSPERNLSDKWTFLRQHPLDPFFAVHFRDCSGEKVMI